MADSTETPPRRGRPRSRKSRDEILDAVRGLLISEGYAKLTIEGVAARAGVAKTTIYRWWPTKGELVLDAAKEAISIGLVPETGDPGADVRHAIEQLIETFSRPLAAIVIFAAITPAGDDPAMARIFRESYVYPWRVSAARALGRLAGGRVDDAEIGFLLDLVVGTIFQRALVLKEPDTAGLRDRLVGLVLREIGPG